MDINLIEKIFFTALVVSFVAYCIIKMVDADDLKGNWGFVFGCSVLAALFGGSAVSVVTALILIWSK